MEKSLNPISESAHAVKIINGEDIMVSCDYDMGRNKTINFLLDYSKGLMEKRLFDYTVRNWQIENAELLKKFGITFGSEKTYREDFLTRSKEKILTGTKYNDESEDEFFKLNLEFGNLSEGDVLKNLESQNGNRVKLLQRMRKREDDSAGKRDKKKSKTGEGGGLDPASNNIVKDYVIPTEDISFASDKHADQSISLKLKKPDSKMLLKNIINFTDETFDNIIKEFLNINDFPREAKDKLGLLKKFISIYKKIKTDKTKLNHFLEKIAERLSEPIDEIKALLEFENLRSKREGNFCNLSKQVNKFVNFLAENDITDIKDLSEITENPKIKEKLDNFQSKVEEYLASYKDIFAYFNEKADDNIDPYQLINKFLPSFKLSKFSYTEGRDKIVRRTKEYLDKAKIAYDDACFNSLIPKDENEQYDQMLSKTYKDLSEMDQFPKVKTNIDKDPHDSEEMMKPYLFNLSMQNNTEGFIPGKNQNQVQNAKNLRDSLLKFQSQSTKFELCYMSKEGFHLPVVSNRYLVKDYENNDFPEYE